jgi:hypothetical protein
MAQTTLLAVLAVFAASYQPAHDRSPQKPWAADGSANKRTAKRWLFRRCFSLFLSKGGTQPREDPHDCDDIS